MRLHLYVLLVFLVVIGVMVMTSSAILGLCIRHEIKYREVCRSFRQANRESYIAWCPFIQKYKTSFRTMYRTNYTNNCRLQSYRAVVFECCGGFAGDGTQCTDINECTTGDHDCFNGATCVNTMGGYKCVCSAAHTGIYCDLDVDECATGIHDCFSGPYCNNLDGSFTCSCPPGYTDQQPSNPGRNCSDIDECAERTSECQNDSQCVNTDGDYYCVCLDGYTGRRCEEHEEILA
ncbi:uncharacterized protein [Diadema setosum]|uniref:uncharacterized protein isoform X1 n=1 Tax=Diadema setosum TaxID=31175 RepID=UPI003B3B8915